MLIVVAVSLLMSCLLGQNVNATEYHVGSGQTPYSTLQELQSAVITWYDDDVIFLHNDDGSLDYAFDFNGKRITISGNAKISSSGTNVRFSTTSSTTFLTIADGSSITWDGLKNFNGEGGAIYSSDNVNISGTSTFSNNTAGWYGGAILCSGNVDISGTSTFSNNTTISSYGGAIYSSGNVDISGTSTFSNNTAIYSGGAIFSLGNVDISGTSTFSNNTANYYSGGGGAIYSSGNINITASEGDIVFAGNKANVSPNAIYMNNAGNNKTLSLAATEGNSVLLYDPIVNVGTLGGININNGTTDKGTVLFDTYQSNISGNTTVFNGTLALSSGAVYGATINAGSFELKEDATLLVTGKDNTINSSGNVALTGTLVFDLTGVNTGETLLTCNGTTSGTIKKIDIRNFNGTGNFGLVKTTSGTLAIDASPILTTHGELIDNTRANGGASFSVTGTNTLRLNSNVKKQTITWTGNTNNIWNATTENWEDGGNAAIKFLHGDDVIFSDSSNALHNITIQDGGVTIGDTMTFADKGTWTYTGGEIEGGTIIVADNADTKIYFDTRPMNQRIEVGNSANVTIVPIFNNTLTFKNFSNSMYDGAIYAGSGSNLTIGEEGSNVVFDANSATYGGAIYSYGNVDISGTSTFSNNTATYYGGAIRSSGNVDISGTSTFSNNTANYYGGTYSNGGAISSSGNVDISGTSTFSNNTANYWGGAIDSGGDVTISGTSTFSNNTANYYGGGAIFSSGNVDISGTSTFSNNTATSYGGGAISSSGNVDISGTSTFSNNTATSYGGAIRSSGNVDISGTSIFSNNTANYDYGGAIHSSGNVDISGTSTFSNNTANYGYGGAIYSSGNINITASEGDIVFAGNKAKGSPNAIYMRNNNDKILSLAATSGNNVKFYDPIESDSYNSNLTININDGGQTGTVLFDTYQSNISGNTTVSNGTLALSGGAVYGADGNNGTFTLQNNATLLTTGSGNKINTGTENVTLDGTLAFENIDQANGTLDFNTGGTITGTVTTIDIRDNTLADGQRYVLAKNTGTADFSSLILPTQIDYNGQSIANTRAEDNVFVTTDDTDKTLVLLVKTLENATVTWNGNTNAEWNISNRNWSGKLANDDNVNQFLHNDNVIFSTTTRPVQKNVTVNSSGVNVATMTVDENDYTFSGGKITGTSLNLNSDETIFQNEIDFTNEIIVAQNKMITFDYNTNNITDTNTFRGDGTLNKTGTQKLTLSNALTENLNIQVNNGELELNNSAQTIKTLNGTNNGIVNLRTADITISNGGTFGGQLTGNGNLILTGGTLTLTGNSNSATGLFNQTDGIVNLQNVWGGSYTQSNSATLILFDNAVIGGDANLSGVVDITNGKLDVGGNLVLTSGSVLKMTVGENKIVADSVTIDSDAKIELSAIPTERTEKVIVSNTPLDPSQLAHHFTQSNKLLVSFQPFYSIDYKEMGLTHYSQSAEQYTTQNNFRKNQIQIAALLDGYSPTRQLLNSLDTREQLESLVKSLLVPELAAEAIALPLNNPYFRIFNHVNNLPLNNNLRNRNSQSTNSGTTFRGQSACSPIDCNVERNKYELWFEGYYQGGETHGDAAALSYKTSRGGMMVGADQYFDDGLLLGLIFGYGNPRVYNSVGKIEADDYTFGVYSRIKIFGIYTNTFVGYGNQNYQLRQNINSNQHTNYNGDSFYASLEFFQPINLRNDLSVSPLFAIDFQKAWSDGFKTNAYIPLTVNKGNIDQTVLRVGVNSNYKNLRTRLQYGYQIAGDHYGFSRTSITGNNGNRILTGVNLGRHTLNAGLGGDFKIGNRTKLFADYDLDLGKHATNHTGQFGFVRYF